MARLSRHSKTILRYLPTGVRAIATCLHLMMVPMMVASGLLMGKTFGIMSIVISSSVAKGFYCRLFRLLFCVSPFVTCAGQQVIVVYRCEEKPAMHHIEDGRTLDFPAKITMNTLRTTMKNSTWIQDSLTFTNLGVFADGFQLYASGVWEYRNKVAELKYSHKLYYGANEFVEEPLIDHSYEGCSDWVVHPKETKSILGIACTRAVHQCNEREYVAYFAKSIPIMDGPSYLPSLPGLILEYDDARFHYLATDIDAKDGEILPPTTMKKITSGKYSQADSRVVINQQTLSASNWVKLGKYYLIQ